jgi:hypothetical protein
MAFDATPLGRELVGAPSLGVPTWPVKNQPFSRDQRTSITSEVAALEFSLRRG